MHEQIFSSAGRSSGASRSTLGPTARALALLVLWSAAGSHSVAEEISQSAETTDAAARLCDQSNIPSSELCKAGPDPTMLNLTWKSLDDNGLPHAPIWKVQDATPRLCAVDVDSEATCGGFPVRRRWLFFKSSSPNGVPECTTGQTQLDKIGFQDLAHILMGWVSGAGPILACRHHPLDAILGHINWVPVSYDGAVSFDSWGGPDLDVTFAFEPKDGIAIGSSRQKSAISAELGLPGAPLHIEVHAPDSFDHFTPGFREFAGGGKAKRRELISRRPAVATGLLGLDLDHEIFGELHPLYSLAWQGPCEPGDHQQKWFVFYTNAADEGWVSNGRSHYLGLGTPSFRVALPTDVAAAPTLSAAELFTNQEDHSVTYSVQYRGAQPVLAFRWKAPAGTAVRIHGSITLSWPAGQQGVCKASPPMDTLAAAPSLTEVRAPLASGAEDVEDAVGSILSHGSAGAEGGLVQAAAPVEAADRHVVDAETAAEAGASAGTATGTAGLCPATGPCDGLRAVVGDQYISDARAAANAGARVGDVCRQVEKISSRSPREARVYDWCRSHGR